ncbi:MULTISPECIES: hypothetical protein [Acinetobacter]|nr:MULTISPECIES: hypothetical protein [Acinetobacter]MCG6037359.1 hypothetical protein [Acinetobacter baumannii]MCU4636287.1 hypothetical protein [Acinetobacter sp. WU_MDCI_Abxa265]RFF23960.1 hypothetical protein DZ985_11540 [Acinetobacter sp. JW]
MICIFLKFNVLCKKSHIFQTYCSTSNYYRLSSNHLEKLTKLLGISVN